MRHGDRTSFSGRDACAPSGVSEEIYGAAWRPHPLKAGGDACVPGQAMVRHGDRTSLKQAGTPAHPDLQFTNYDLLLFFSVADDLFVVMLVKGSFTVQYRGLVYMLH